MRAGRPWNGTRSWAIRIQRASDVVLGEQLEHGLVGSADVGRVAGERHPAERALALAEQRPDEGGHETREVEGVRRRRPPVPGRGCCCRSRKSPCRPTGARASPEPARPSTPWTARCRHAGRAARKAAACGKAHPGRHIPVQRVVGGRLVRERVEALAAAHELRLDLSGVADQARSMRRARRRLLPATMKVPSSSESVTSST